MPPVVPPVISAGRRALGRGDRSRRRGRSGAVGKSGRLLLAVVAFVATSSAPPGRAQTSSTASTAPSTSAPASTTSPASSTSVAGSTTSSPAVSQPATPTTVIVPGAVSPFAVPPAAPRNVRTVIDSPTQITVSWDPPAAGGRAIREHRITPIPGAASLTAAMPATSAVFAGLIPGVTYYFSVRAIADDGVASEATLSSGVVLGVAPVPAGGATVAPSTVAAPGRSTCPGAFPTEVQGTPTDVQQSGSGAVVWMEGRTWYVQVFNRTSEPMVFSGLVSADPPTDATAVRIEPRQDLVRRRPNATVFSFVVERDVDTLRIESRCLTRLSLVVARNGVPLRGDEVWVGRAGVHPASARTYQWTRTAP